MVYGLLPTTLANNGEQGQWPSDLMNLLRYGGFFRDNGLNSLPSIKHMANLLGETNFFKRFTVKTENIEEFLNESKWLTIDSN